jgi:acetamidase/formamidase
MAKTSVLPAGRTHHFPSDRVHFTWDVDHEPVLTIASGETVVVQTRDVSDNQLNPESTAADLDIDWDRVYPLAGPIAIEGAEPGHTLAVEILDLHPLGWGWTAILPELGLLPEDFPDPYLRIFDLTQGDVTYLREDIAIPIAPFLGTMGVCPDGYPPARGGDHPVPSRPGRRRPLQLR